MIQFFLQQTMLIFSLVGICHTFLIFVYFYNGDKEYRIESGKALVMTLLLSFLLMLEAFRESRYDKLYSFLLTAVVFGFIFLMITKIEKRNHAKK